VESVGVFGASGNGTIAYSTGGAAGLRKLQWFDRSGRLLSTVGPVGIYRNPELSPDGKRIAIDETDPRNMNEDIWMIDVAQGMPTRWTFNPGIDMYPVWSPTGEQIAFGSSRDGAVNIYLQGSNGGTEELLLKGAAIPRDWSRDNRFLVYGVAAGSQLMILPLFGDRKPFPYLSDSSSTTAQARISPDGKWLAYYSDETGREEIYVRNFPVPAAKYQISTDGGFSPRWRRDGKEIFYVSSDGKLIAVPVHTTDRTVDTSTPSVLFNLDVGPPPTPYGIRQQYDATADGQRFIVNVPANAGDETSVTVLWNWPAALKH
jgi:Tol biopolymer transport system component